MKNQWSIVTNIDCNRLEDIPKQPVSL